MIEQGRLLGVLEDTEGSSAASDHLTGSTTLALVDAGDFSEDGGTCRIDVEGDGSAVYDHAYTLAEDSDTLTLSAALTVDVPEGTPVYALTGTGEVSSTLLAEVDLYEDEEDEPVLAEIPSSLAAFFPSGDDAAGSLVDVDSVEDEWVVRSRPYDRPTLQPGAIQPPMISLYLSSGLTIPSGVSTPVTTWSVGFSWRVSPLGSDGWMRIDVPGRYLIVGTLDFTANSTGDRRAIIQQMDYSLAVTDRRTTSQSASASVTWVQVVESFTFPEGYYVRLAAQQGSGANLDLRGAADGSRTALKIIYMGPS